MLEPQQSFEKIFLELHPGELKIPEADAALVARATVERIENPSYEQYREWHDQVGRPYNWHTRARINDRSAIEDLLAQDDTELCLLKLDGNVVGYSLTEMDENRRVEVSDFGFPPDKVGLGYGTVFFPMVVQRLLDNGADSIWLSTRSTNDPRVPNFYEKFGFSIYSRETVSGTRH